MAKRKELLISGMGSILGSFSQVLNLKLRTNETNNNSFEADANALRNDWKIVGDSMRRGINEFQSSKENGNRE